MVYLGHVTHYGHKNIVKGISEWENKESCRNFNTLEEHNEKLIRNINDVVRYDDILYHCGDWSFGGIENVYKFRERINCQIIHLLLGNHDHHIKNNKIVELPQGDIIHLQTLFTTVDSLLIKTINGQNMVLCHYSLRSWDRGAKGSWMLYGHSHGTLEDYYSEIDVGKNYLRYKTMDVGIDTHEEFRPYHFDEIEKIMKDRINLNVDHHAAESTSDFRNKYK